VALKVSDIDSERMLLRIYDSSYITRKMIVSWPGRNARRMLGRFALEWPYYGISVSWLTSVPLQIVRPFAVTVKLLLIVIEDK
jgi:hypothetical protein